MQRSWGRRVSVLVGENKSPLAEAERRGERGKGLP